MGLYERLLRQEEPRIAIHTFFAAMQERALGTTTAITARDFFGLSPAEGQEATTLLNKILEPVAVTDKWRRALEYENVCILAHSGYPDVDTVAKLKARLGV